MAVHNNQRDGYGQLTIPQGKSSYYKNSLGGGCPALADEDVFRHYTEKVDGHKIRQRAESFQDHYSQARMFWKSMSAVEAKHIVAAYAFELGHVEVVEIRSRVVDQLNLIDHDLAARVATELGLPVPNEEPVDGKMPASAALSQLNTATDSIATRKIAVLAADGVDARGVERFIEAMRQRGAKPEVLAHTAGGTLCGGSGGQVAVDRAISATASVLYDAIVVPCGQDSVAKLSDDGYTLHFVTETYKHLKTIGAFGAGIKLLRKAAVSEQIADGPDVITSHGVVTTTAAENSIPEEFFDSFAATLAKHRTWDRDTDAVPA